MSGLAPGSTAAAAATGRSHGLRRAVLASPGLL